MSTSYLKSAVPAAQDTERLRGVRETVTQVIADVRERGDTAVREYSKKFDNWSPESFLLSQEEIDRINDMTQLTLGLDRDSALVAAGFDERDPAVKYMLKAAITACEARGKYVGICGQGPSDHPDLAEWLLEQHIDTMSLNPDTVVQTWTALAERTAAARNSGPAQDAAAPNSSRQKAGHR